MGVIKVTMGNFWASIISSEVTDHKEFDHKEAFPIVLISDLIHVIRQSDSEMYNVCSDVCMNGDTR